MKAQLNWSNPTTRTDGSPLAATDISSINVFDNGVAFANLIGAAITFMTGILTPGDHAFTVEVNDTHGNTSIASNVAAINVPAFAPPSAVSDLAAILTP